MINQLNPVEETKKTIERLQQVYTLQAELENIFDVIKHNGSLQSWAGNEIKKYHGYYASLHELMATTQRHVERNIIYRYSGQGYNHTSTNSISLERRIWQFARQNPLSWQQMNASIYFKTTDITTYEGFLFMDSFIHCGLRVQGVFSVAKKHEQIVFFDSEDEGKENLLFAQGFKIASLDEGVMHEILDC